MNVKSVEKENGKAKVVVEIDKAEFEQALNKAYAKCRKDIMLPGFRKGKAPAEGWLRACMARPFSMRTP